MTDVNSLSTSLVTGKNDVFEEKQKLLVKFSIPVFHNCSVVTMVLAALSTLLLVIGIGVGFQIVFVVLYHFVFDKNMDMAISGTEMVHSVFAVPISAYSMIFVDPLHDPVSYDYYTTPYPYSHIVFPFTFGFFLWHSLQFMVPRSDREWRWPMVIHSVLCLWTYGIIVWTPFMHRDGMIALFYDFSTFWQHVVIMMKHYKTLALINKFKFSSFSNDIL